MCVFVCVHLCLLMCACACLGVCAACTCLLFTAALFLSDAVLDKLVYQHGKVGLHNLNFPPTAFLEIVF